MKIEIHHSFDPSWGMLGWTTNLFIDDMLISSGTGMDRETAIQALAQKVNRGVLVHAKERPYSHLLPTHEASMRKWTEEAEQAEGKRRRH